MQHFEGNFVDSTSVHQNKRIRTILKLNVSFVAADAKLKISIPGRRQKSWNDPNSIEDRTSNEKYLFFFFDMTKARRKCQIHTIFNAASLFTYRVSSVNVRLRRSSHFVSFYCYLELLRTTNRMSVLPLSSNIALLSVFYTLFVWFTHLAAFQRFSYYVCYVLCLRIPYFVYDHKDMYVHRIHMLVRMYIQFFRLFIAVYTRAECVNVCLSFGVPCDVWCMPLCMCILVQMFDTQWEWLEKQDQQSHIEHCIVYHSI